MSSGLRDGHLVGNKGSCALSISWFLIRQQLGDQDVRMPNAQPRATRRLEENAHEGHGHAAAMSRAVANLTCGMSVD
jgi:hypothetical protein